MRLPSRALKAKKTGLSKSTLRSRVPNFLMLSIIFEPKTSFDKALLNKIGINIDLQPTITIMFEKKLIVLSTLGGGDSNVIYLVQSRI